MGLFLLEPEKLGAVVLLASEVNPANPAFVATQIGQAAQPVNRFIDKQHRLSAIGTELTVGVGCSSVQRLNYTLVLGVLSQIRPDTACDEAAFYGSWPHLGYSNYQRTVA